MCIYVHVYTQETLVIGGEKKKFKKSLQKGVLCPETYECKWKLKKKSCRLAFIFSFTLAASIFLFRKGEIKPFPQLLKRGATLFLNKLNQQPRVILMTFKIVAEIQSNKVFSLIVIAQLKTLGSTLKVIMTLIMCNIMFL